MTSPDDALAALRERWGLTADGAAFATPSSILQPVRRGTEPAFLKLATSAEEGAGNAVLRWWDGDGAVRVLAADGDAVLLARAGDGPGPDLTALARSGADGDDEATRILCRTGMRLHRAGRGPRPDGLFDLRRWFRDLLEDRGDDDLLRAAARVAEGLLAHPAGDVVLHGDLHHGNVLRVDAEGWAAIDPKPLHGDPGFDVANILCNPDAEVALGPGRLERAVDVIASETRMDRRRVLEWATAWGALSSVWSVQDGGDPTAARGSPSGHARCWGPSAP